MAVASRYGKFQNTNRDLEILIGLIQAVHQSSDLDQIYKVALDSVVELENVDVVAIYLVDKEKREAVLQGQRNFSEDYIRRASRIPYPRGMTWKVIESGNILNVEDIQKEAQLGPAGRDLGYHSALGIPIFLEGEAIGVIWFLSYKERKFNETEVSLLSSLGKQIAIAIARVKAFEEIKQWKDNLLESERRYQVLVENTYDLVCEISIEGRYLYISSKVKDILGYEPEELVGRSIFEHIHPDDLPDTRVAFIKAASTFSSVNEVFRYRHKNGEWRWLECTGKPFQTAAGDIRGVIACRDITETRLIGEEVLRSGGSVPRPMHLS